MTNLSQDFVISKISPATAALLLTTLFYSFTGITNQANAQFIINSLLQDGSKFYANVIDAWLEKPVLLDLLKAVLER